jgi:FAD/FMN-containing dehydrogenase
LEGDGQPEGRIRALAAYGHCGDSNLHINIVADGYSAETRFPATSPASSPLDCTSLAEVRKHRICRPIQSCPLPPQQILAGAIIVGTACNAEHDEEKLSGLLEHVLSTGLVVDGVLAQDQTQFQRLWHLRESAAEAAGKTGSVYKRAPINR